MLKYETFKFKSTAATVDCQFRYEMCFHTNKHIQLYKLHVKVGNIHQLIDIFYVGRMLGLHGDV